MTHSQIRSTALLGALADTIADRVAARLAPQLVDVVEAGAAGRTVPELAAASEDGLWSAGRVAAHYDVAVRFIYEHADQLGCVRIGSGRRPRLRFDPDVVRQRWSRVGAALPEPKPTRRRKSSRRNARTRSGRPSFELLDFDREP